MMKFQTYTIKTVCSSFLAIFLMFSVSSCLDKEPGDYIGESEGMKTFNDAEQTLTGIYSAYKSSALYSGYLTLCPDIQSDLVYAVEGNTNVYGSFWLWKVRSTGATFSLIRWLT